MHTTRRPLRRSSLMRQQFYRTDVVANMTAVEQAIGREVAKAVDELAKRMTLNEAVDLATQAAGEAGAGYQGWAKIEPIKAALAKLVGPAPMTCTNCGAGLVCSLCGANGRTK